MNTSKIAPYANPDEILEISAQDAIMSMFEHTDENGILYVPEWNDGSRMYSNKIYKCRMNWDENDAKNVVKEYERLYSAIEMIAKEYDETASEDDVADFPEEVKNVWRTYIRDFDEDDYDIDKIDDISWAYDTIADVEAVAAKIEAGAEVSDAELSYYNEYKDTTVSEEDAQLYESYANHRTAECEERIGKGIAAQFVVVGAKRICAMLNDSAPQLVIKNELRQFAQALAIHKYCTEIEAVDTVD